MTTKRTVIVGALVIATMSLLSLGCGDDDDSSGSGASSSGGSGSGATGGSSNNGGSTNNGGSSNNGGSNNGGSAGNTTAPTCEASCAEIVAKACANGPADEATCTSDCESFRTGPCKDKYFAIFDCSGANPTYVCDAQGLVTVQGCETQMSDLAVCLSSQ